MAVKIGERCATESRRVIGMLCSIGEKMATVRKDDGSLANVPYHTLRQANCLTKLPAPTERNRMPPLFDCFVVIEIKTGNVTYMGECIASAAAVLHPGTCYAGADSLHEAMRLARQRAACFRERLAA